MKPIVFNKELTNENIIALMEEIYDTVTTGSIIYFSGCGKNVAGEKMLVNFINNLVDRVNYQSEIIAYDKLHNSAFTIFFKVNLPKKVLNTATGLIQLPQDIVAMKDTRKESRFMYDTYKKDNENFIKWILPLYFNKTEARKIRTGKPLYRDSATLKDICMNYANLLIEPVV